jgi:hypothetical protein
MHSPISASLLHSCWPMCSKERQKETTMSLFLLRTEKNYFMFMIKIATQIIHSEILCKSKSNGKNEIFVCFDIISRHNGEFDGHLY